MPRCRICEERVVGTIEIKDPKWVIYRNVPTAICSKCFNLWASGNDKELEKRHKTANDLKELAKAERPKHLVEMEEELKRIKAKNGK